MQLATDSDSNKSEPDIGRMSRSKSHAWARGPSSKGQRGSLRRMTLTFLIEHTQEFYLRAYARSPPLIGTTSLQILYSLFLMGISTWYSDWPSGISLKLDPILNNCLIIPLSILSWFNLSCMDRVGMHFGKHCLSNMWVARSLCGLATHIKMPTENNA